MTDNNETLYTLADIKDFFQMLYQLNDGRAARNRDKKYIEAVDDAMKKLMDADRVKVVRCADCRYWKANNAEEGDASGICMNGYSPAGTTDMNWFCADGEMEG